MESSIENDPRSFAERRKLEGRERESVNLKAVRRILKQSNNQTEDSGGRFRGHGASGSWDENNLVITKDGRILVNGEEINIASSVATFPLGKEILTGIGIGISAINIKFAIVLALWLVLSKSDTITLERKREKEDRSLVVYHATGTKKLLEDLKNFGVKGIDIKRGDLTLEEIWLWILCFV